MNSLTIEKPLVYPCSGCSSAAQMTNFLAVQLDRQDFAEMSCIAGIGGRVKKMVSVAQSGRKIIAIDGCPLACSKACLGMYNIQPDYHFDLKDFGVEQKRHEDFNMEEAHIILKIIKLAIRDNITPYTGVVRVSKRLSPPTPSDKPTTRTLNTSNLCIVEVTTKRQLTAFIDLPYRLYQNNKYYVPPLKKDTIITFDPKKNPAYDFCEARQWLAYKGDTVVGRIAGIINYAFIAKWKKYSVRFGWLDFEEDEEIAIALLEQVESWGREKGLTSVHGPLGFTNFDPAGMLVEGFDQLGTFATLYNYPYYQRFLEKAGYYKDVDWVEYKIKLPAVMPANLEKIAAIVQKRHGLLIVRTVRRKDIMPYAHAIFRLLNDTYADLFGVVALNERQIEYSIKKYLSFIRPDFVSLIVEKNGALVAFGITMPSMSLAMQKAKGHLFPFGFIPVLKAFKKNNQADLCLVAVRKDFQGKGVNSILMKEMTRIYIQNGITHAESNPELESNIKVQAQWEYYDAVQHKRRRCYIKYIHA